MFDSKLEVMVLVEEREAFNTCLLTGTEEAGVDHHGLKLAEAVNTLCVSFAWLLGARGYDCVL